MNATTFPAFLSLLILAGIWLGRRLAQENAALDRHIAEVLEQIDVERWEAEL